MAAVILQHRLNALGQLFIFFFKESSGIVYQASWSIFKAFFWMLVAFLAFSDPTLLQKCCGAVCGEPNPWLVVFCRAFFYTTLLTSYVIMFSTATSPMTASLMRLDRLTEGPDVSVSCIRSLLHFYFLGTRCSAAADIFFRSSTSSRFFQKSTLPTMLSLFTSIQFHFHSYIGNKNSYLKAPCIVR